MKELKLLRLNIQHFARKKNALTEHYIAPIPEGVTEPDYLRIAKWISNVEPSPEEETEDQAYYDGDGTPETDVISVKTTWAFEGMYDDDDPAHQFLRTLEFETGEGRKVMYKQVRQDGTVLEGKATVTELVVTGGEASAFEQLSFTIAWDRKPEITQSTP